MKNNFYKIMKNISLFVALGLSISYVNGSETTTKASSDLDTSDNKEKREVSVPSKKTDDPDESLLDKMLEKEHKQIERAKKQIDSLLQKKTYNKTKRSHNLSVNQPLPPLGGSD